MNECTREFDLVVAGGGIYGILCALEAALRSQRVMLVEQRDWGSGTTDSWLRILHGGLRYLQTADLPRFMESVRERRWFIDHFPDCVRPLPCVMPLYRGGPHSRLKMRAALAANDLLSLGRNRRVDALHRLPRGSIVNASECRERLPFVNDQDLIGGAIWYDAVVEAPDRLLSRLLAVCRRRGVVLRAPAELVGIETEGDRLAAVDLRTKDGDICTIQAAALINATGHSVPHLAKSLGSPIPHPPANSWAWNVLFDVPYAGNAAAAVHANERGAQTFFVVPWHGRALVGTGHVPVEEDTDESCPPDLAISEFVSAADASAPGLGLSVDRISRVLAGFLPVERDDPSRLTSRPLVVDHANLGLRGCYSVWGIKFTTARAVAERLIDRIFGKQAKRPGYPDLKLERGESPSPNTTVN